MQMSGLGGDEVAVGRPPRSTGSARQSGFSRTIDCDDLFTWPAFAWNLVPVLAEPTRPALPPLVNYGGRSVRYCRPV